MPSLSAIAYVSSAVRRFTQAELEALLLDARSFNERVHVSGALLHHDGSFFQYFEGPPAGVNEVYERIRKSRRHHNIIELLSGPVPERYFSAWYMGFAEVPGTGLLRLAQAEWQNALKDAVHRQSQPPGVKLLLDFWSCANRW